MKTPEETACALVDDFWSKGGACTQEYAREKIGAALKEAMASERRAIIDILGEATDEVCLSAVEKLKARE